MLGGRLGRVERFVLARLLRRDLDQSQRSAPSLPSIPLPPAESGALLSGSAASTGHHDEPESPGGTTKEIIGLHAKLDDLLGQIISKLPPS